MKGKVRGCGETNYKEYLKLIKQFWCRKLFDYVLQCPWPPTLAHINWFQAMRSIRFHTDQHQDWLISTLLSCHITLILWGLCISMQRFNRKTVCFHYTLGNYAGPHSFISCSPFKNRSTVLGLSSSHIIALLMVPWHHLNLRSHPPLQLKFSYPRWIASPFAAACWISNPHKGTPLAPLPEVAHVADFEVILDHK